MRSPVATIKDIKAQPPITPWNLGVFDALVLADKMTGCPGGFRRLGRTDVRGCPLVVTPRTAGDPTWTQAGLGGSGGRGCLQGQSVQQQQQQQEFAAVLKATVMIRPSADTMWLPACWLCVCAAGTPGFVDISGTTAGTKMLQAMSEVGSTPLLALLMGYQPQEVPLEQQAAAVAAARAAAQQDAQQQQQPERARPVLSLPFDAAAVANSTDISWVCVDSSKPVSVFWWENLYVVFVLRPLDARAAAGWREVCQQALRWGKRV